jgi:hypothetical protein
MDNLMSISDNDSYQLSIGGAHIYRRTTQEDEEKNNATMIYDKEKYREMILDAAETVLGYFGFDRTVYGNKKNIAKGKRWWHKLIQEREKDIQIETMEKQKQ